MIAPVALLCLALAHPVPLAPAQEETGDSFYAPVLDAHYELTEFTPYRVPTRRFVGAVALASVLTIYDVETTFDCRGVTCHEANPFMRPFVNRGRVETYAAQGVLEFGFVYLSHRFRTSENPHYRRLWWLPLAPALFGHGILGTWNLQF